MDEKVSEWFEEHGWRNFGGWEAAAHQAAQDYAAHVADPLAEALRNVRIILVIEGFEDNAGIVEQIDAALAAYNRMKEGKR